VWCVYADPIEIKQTGEFEMQTFTGYEYLLMDAANHFGMDKELFEPRIQWAQDNLADLESLVDKADCPALYTKAVMAIRKAQRGEPTGHRVGLDAVCSGMQIMSVLTGCVAGATATGLIDPNRRADAYTDLTSIMRRFIPGLPDSERGKIKNACMTSLYGSKAEPKKEFGDGTDELNAFYKSMYIMAPGACDLLSDLLDSWQPYALSHDWKLPDGFDAHVPTREVVEKRIEVAELGGTRFTYQYKENVGLEYDRKNAANMVHSVDVYLLRSLIRRCNYDRDIMEWASEYIEMVLLERSIDVPDAYCDETWCNETFRYLKERYEATNMPDVRILDHSREYEIRAMSTQHLQALAKIVNQMLEHKPFPVIAIHDEFTAHANNMNQLRAHYIEIMAGLADSTILDDIFQHLHGTTCNYTKLSTNLADKIRISNYALC
jgi:hypothetical protein